MFLSRRHFVVRLLEATGEDENFGKSFCSGCQVLPKSFCSRCKVFRNSFCSEIVGCSCFIRFAHFSDHYKIASPVKLLQNEGARPQISNLQGRKLTTTKRVPKSLLQNAKKNKTQLLWRRGGWKRAHTGQQKFNMHLKTCTWKGFCAVVSVIV